MTTTFVGRTYLYETNNNFMFRFVVPIATECVQRFHDSKKQYLLPSGKILYSIASSSPYAFHLVIKTVLPAMQVVWQDLKLPSEKKMLLVVYNYILQARLNQPDITDSSPHSRSRLQDPAISKTFDEFREGIVEVYFGAVSNLTQEPSSSNMSFGAAAIQGLVLSFKIPEYLSNVEKGIVVRELNSMLATPPKDNDIRLAALSSLQEISAVEPKTFQDITLLNYLEMLPDNVSQDADERKVELDIIVGHLQDLVQIACSRPCQKELSGGPPANMPSSYWHRNFDTMEKKLLDKLDLVLQNNGHLDYANVILAAICGGLQIFDTNLNLARTKAQEPMPANPKVGPYTYIVTALFQKIVEQKDHPNGLAGAFELRYTGIKKPFDDKFVQMVGRIAMWALRSDLTTPANNFLLNWNALFPDEPSAIWTLFTPGTSLKSLSTSQQNLEHGPKDKCLANALSMYLLAGNRRTEPFMFVEVSSCR
jgi:DNA repair/transcription protein MET18/MMS19